jgi:CheY-like chemotaxis protein
VCILDRKALMLPICIHCKERDMATILVVDDSAFARANICAILQEAGYKTLEAGDGLQGLEMAVKAQPDGIFSDLLMPNMDGIAFVSALRERQISLPVVVLTADIQEARRQQCLDLGVKHFLQKPPRKAELLQAAEEMLNRASM